MTPTDKRAYYRNPCNSRRMVRGWCSAWPTNANVDGSAFARWSWAEGDKR